MALDRHELFITLLKKLRLSQVIQQKPYSTGKIDKLEIHTKSKLWCLYIGLDSILPYRQFTQFYQKLRSYFNKVAQLKLFIEVQKPQLTNRLIQDYWGWVLQHSNLPRSTASRMAKQFQPRVNDRQILLMAPNEVVRSYLQKQNLQSIPDDYERLGFPKLGIKIKLKHRTTSDLQKLHHEKQKSDARVIKSAADSLKKKRARRRLQAMGIGQLINDQNQVVPIGDIYHEARSITIEGVVKAEELQPLISGRKLLLITLADRTASIKVKIFAKNRSGQEASTSIKKGSHLKIQGSVRADQATQDLMINAYNINLLKAGEK